MGFRPGLEGGRSNLQAGEGIFLILGKKETWSCLGERPIIGRVRILRSSSLAMHSSLNDCYSAWRFEGLGGKKALGFVFFILGRVDRTGLGAKSGL